jgi:hypothetical protein
MANVKNYGLSGISTVVEFGKKGQKLSSTGSTFGVYEADGATLTNILVKNGAADQDAVAFKQMNDAISTAIGRLTAGLVYKGIWDASGATLATALPQATALVPLAPGDFWKISAASTIALAGFSDSDLKIGDMIICNTAVANGTPTVVANFDKIDNTEAADILRTGDISDEADLASTVGGVDAKLAKRGVIATWVNLQITNATAADLVGAVYSRTVALASGSASSLNIGAALPANATVVKALVQVTEAFDGTAPTVALGFSGSTSVVAGVAETDLTTVGLYEISCLVNDAASKQYIATYTADSSAAGAATIVLQYTNGVQA